MAKIRLIGKVVTDVISGTVGQNNNKTIKYLVEVAISSGQGNDSKKSYFAITAFGKQAELPIQKGITVELDGQMEIAKFQLNEKAQPKDAVVIKPEYTTILQGNVAHFAKAYNIFGNLVKDNAEIYYPQSGGKTVYSQKIAVSNFKNNQEHTSFYTIKLFGDIGEFRHSKNQLNKSVIKSVLIDGSISATYTTKEQNGEKKEYFNVDILVNDFQITSRVKSSTTGENSTGTAQQAYANVGTYNEPPVEFYDEALIDINEDEIPF